MSFCPNDGTQQVAKFCARCGHQFPDAVEVQPEVQVFVHEAPVVQQVVASPANWYPDVNTPGYERYWDGYQWTEHLRPAMQYQQPVYQQPIYQQQTYGYAQPVYVAPVEIKETAEQLSARLVYGEGYSAEKNCANCGTKLRAGSCSVCSD